MPAENIMATHEVVENSGSSPSRPRGMLPYLPRASHRAKTTKADDVRTNSQPRYSIVPVSAVPEALASEAVSRNPHSRKPIAIAAVTPKTTLSRSWGRSDSAEGSTSRAGCGMTVSVGDLKASEMSVCVVRRRSLGHGG